MKKPTLMYVNAVKHKKLHMFSIQIYFGTVSQDLL